MTPRERVAAFWDDHVQRWLEGADPLPDPLTAWYSSYAGMGRGAVTRAGFVEPYQGDVLGDAHEPRLVVMGLNPGGYAEPFQSRSGVFADEIRAAGSYRSWALTAPYLRAPWTTRYGPNRYFNSRLAFTGR
jgi:hypothetical protein